MKHNYFSLKFINLLYAEVDIFERLELEHALLEDDHLMTEYKSLMSSKDSLPKVLFSPSNDSVQKILAYA